MTQPNNQINKTQSSRPHLLVPPMDNYLAILVAGVFKSVGYNARPVAENMETLSVGMKHTGGGECIPCPSVLGSFMKTIQDEKLPPEQVTLFLPTSCGPCRFGQYNTLNSLVFEKQGWKGISLINPSDTDAYGGLEINARKKLWHAFVLADVMRKLNHKIHPYEKNQGETDSIIDYYLKKIHTEFYIKEEPATISDILAEAIDALERVPVRKEKRPLVGVVGEIYVRCNSFINENVCRRIEELGGEAMLSPVAEWVLYSAYFNELKAKEKKLSIKSIKERIGCWLEKNLFWEKIEHHYYKIADHILHDRKEYPIFEILKEGEKYLPWQFEGEAILTLGRAALFVKRDNAKAIVNTSPMFCMPGTITTSIFPQLEKELKVPVINNFYDGSGDPNKSLIPVMHYVTSS